MSTVDDTIVSESVSVDLTTLSLRELLLDGDAPLDRAMRAVVAGLSDDGYAAFSNAPRGSTGHGAPAHVTPAHVTADRVTAARLQR